jgi:hypothetical protein
MTSKLFTLQRTLGLLLLLALAGACGAALSCRRAAAPQAAAVPKTPSVRLYVASTLAGALEPCGCRKDMLGGVDHAAALIAKGKHEAPDSLVVSAGPLLFLNPELAVERRQQELWKAESLAASAKDIALVAWAPGVNDFSAGSADLTALATASGARMLAANLKVPGAPITATQIVEVGGYRVGIVGVSDLPPASLPQGTTASDLKDALLGAQAALKQQGAQVTVALVAAQRGQALRLAETVPGFQVLVVGKPLDKGEGNDAPTPPVLIGQTLVVQAPNHLQALAVVDLFVRDGELQFKDGSGIEAEEQKLSLQSRSAELQRRIVEWKAQGNVAAADLAAREADLAKLQAQLNELSQPKEPPLGSFFRYELREVNEKLGADERVAGRLSDYYKRVNTHNKDAFKDKQPLPVKEGDPSYVGVNACTTCHQSQVAFWQNTRHARAYPTLSNQFKEYNLDCVGCHVTGYERPGGSTVTFVEELKNVQCEECHGPGSTHAATKTKGSIRRTPTPDQCKKCHHAPHVHDDWAVQDAWPHIIGPGHGLPLNAAAAPTATATAADGTGGAGH